MRWVRRFLWIGVLTGLLVGGWLFAARNETPVRVHYLFGETLELALWQALLLAFGAGALLVGAFATLAALRHGLVQRRYRKLISGLETEVHQLRSLPLAEASEAAAGLAGDPRPSGLRRDA